MRETTAAQCPIHPMETQPCPACLATMDNSMASYNAGYAAGYRAAQEEQSAATPAAGRPDAGAAQAVTDGPAADPDASVITYARIGLRYMHDPRVRATYSDLIDLAERMARERDEAQRECEEQARLLGMSGSREAALLSERDALRAVVRAADYMRTREEHSGSSPGCVSCAAIAVYDAARAKVKGTI